MCIDNYRDFKDFIGDIFKKSKQEMVEEALGMISLDGQKPTLCLMRVQRMLAECKLTLNDDVFKQRLTQSIFQRAYTIIKTSKIISAAFSRSQNKKLLKKP